VRGTGIRLTSPAEEEVRHTRGVYLRPRDMPHRLCASCGSPGRLVEGPSQDSQVDYYRCDYCGHVWAIRKDDPARRQITITVDRRKQNDAPEN
jgi:DNA-directed RNA polymerase subunit RPC12/RpoP